jgi:hypothetical protein
MDTTLRNQIIELYMKGGYNVNWWTDIEEMSEKLNIPCVVVYNEINKDDDGKWLKSSKLAWFTRYYYDGKAPLRSFWASQKKEREHIPFVGLLKIQQRFVNNFDINPSIILGQELINGVEFMLVKLNEGITIYKENIKYIHLHPNGNLITYADLKNAA